MKTTLKRGLGRGSAADPAPAPTRRIPLAQSAPPPPPRRRRRPRIGRVLAWAGAVIVILAGGIAAGVYLYVHESLADIAPRGEEVRRAAEKLDVVLPGLPANALVIGYDRRAGEGGGLVVARRHADAYPRRPGASVHVAALVPA